MPLTCTYRIDKAVDSGSFTPIGRSSQAVLSNDLTVCAIATHIFSIVVTTEMSGPIDVTL